MCLLRQAQDDTFSTFQFFFISAFPRRVPSSLGMPR